MSHIKFLTFFFLFFLIVSCDDYEIIPVHLDTYLKLYTQDKGQVMYAVQNSPFDDISKYINYGVSDHLYMESIEHCNYNLFLY